jgi:phosphoribosylaminoimidazolecarboxamide formyltransferase / IMP cyclohydrolase
MNTKAAVKAVKRNVIMTLNVVDRIDDLVPLRNVLLSVSDKTGLELLVPGLRDINPQVRFLSTGGTFTKLRQILGQAADEYLLQVSDYTGQPETQGGLVKTLDFKIYLGLLTETYNPDHQADLQRTGAVLIDMVVVNLYPFQATVAQPDTTAEGARGNIDIGGPCMLRAAAKNFIRVASVVDPHDYERILNEATARKGHTSLALRYDLAGKAFDHTAQYDRAIADYLAGQPVDKMKSCYRTA